MSDLFHELVPADFIVRAYDVMRRAHWHSFQVLTKRADRVAALASDLPWGPNIWQGVSVENALYLDRIRALRTVPAAVRFLSLEPLLGPLSALPLDEVAVSRDGRTWRPAAVLEEHASGEYSYPAMIQTRDGLVHVEAQPHQVRRAGSCLDRHMTPPQSALFWPCEPHFSLSSHRSFGLPAWTACR